MSKARSGGSGPFLLEMLAATGFFAICAALCAAAFVKAELISRGAEDLNQAARAAQVLAEEYHAGRREPGECVYWDDDWKQADTAEGAAWAAVLTEEASAPGTERSRIQISDLTGREEPIFELEVARYE